MKYRRALLLTDPGNDAEASLSTLHRLAPQLERVLLLVPLPTPTLAGSGDVHDKAHDEFEALRARAAGVAAKIDVQPAPELTAAALAALCAAEEIDLLVLMSSLRSASLLSAVRRQLWVAVLWIAHASRARRRPTDSRTEIGPIEHVGCVAADERSRAAIAAFLRDHADPTLQVVLFTPTPVAPDVLSAALAVSGVEAVVQVSSPLDASSLGEWLDEWTVNRPLDLLVFARIPIAIVLSRLWNAPVLLLPPPTAAAPFGRRTLDGCDLVELAGALRARIDHAPGVGPYVPVPDQEIAIVSGGRLIASATTRDGDLALPVGLAAASLGLYRHRDNPLADPVAAVELRVDVIRAGTAPLIVFDAELRQSALENLAARARSSGWQTLAVRMRPARSAHSLRRRLRARGLAAQVADARAILDEGEALDVSESFDAVRLSRVAKALRSAGFPVSAIVYSGPLAPALGDLAAVSGELLALDACALPQTFEPGSARDELPSIPGNRVELEIDNATARRWLLEIAHCRHSLQLQVYMVLDDDIGRAVEAALIAAAARGVQVQLLVDSLHGLHGSFGVYNPLLERLGAQHGIELRAARPITELPSLTELKQRDHRKLVIADGQVALVGGRNLSHEYYVGFDEARLATTSLWREVPWLDAGARIEGPAVAALAGAFLEAWTGAGGKPFDVVTPAASGSVAARVILHRGLRDARTLETYLALIETAKSHLYVVNGFPLALELQHALLRALRRGLRVRTLIGHLTPTHDGQPFGGPWAGARSAATELVHSRVDPLVAAGGEVYLFAQRERAGWAHGLGVVHPHVHAKVMSADGQRCTIGSANLDITASYWESELLVTVDDATLVAAFEVQLETLFAGSTPVQPDDPEWQEHARKRAWMRHWPGVFSV